MALVPRAGRQTSSLPATRLWATWQGIRVRPRTVEDVPRTALTGNSEYGVPPKAASSTRRSLATVAATATLAACAAGLAGCGSDSTSRESRRLASGSGASSSRPTLADIKRAIVSTGVLLCADLAKPNQTQAHLFPQYHSEKCSDSASVKQGMAYVFIGGARSSVAKYKRLMLALKKPTWEWRVDIVVADDEPPAGLDAALYKLGFRRVH